MFGYWWRHAILRGHTVVRRLLCKVTGPGLLLHDGVSSEAIEAVLYAHVLLRWLNGYATLNGAVFAAGII